MKKTEERFHCDRCDYSTNHRGHWRAHLRSVRHKSRVDGHVCSVCNRVYKHRQSLHKHQKKCHSDESVGGSGVDMGSTQSELLKVIEQLIPRVNQTTNNINIQILLNKECGDAMTIQTFATNLRMSLEDICRQKDSGRSNSVSKIVSENLGPLRMQDRPIHCTGAHSSKWLIHDERGGWREDSGNTVFRAASFGITKRFQELWDEAHPNWRNDEQLRSSWIDIVACLNADPSDKEVADTLDRLSPCCRLSSEELKSSLLLAAENQ